MQRFEVIRNGNLTGEFLEINVSPENARKLDGSTITLRHATESVIELVSTPAPVKSFITETPIISPEESAEVLGPPVEDSELKLPKKSRKTNSQN